MCNLHSLYLNQLVIKLNNKLVEWANKGQMNFNVDECSLMYIRQNNVKSRYNMSNQQLPTKDQQWKLLIIIIKDLKFQKQTKELQMYSCWFSRISGYGWYPQVYISYQRVDSHSYRDRPCRYTDRARI